MTLSAKKDLQRRQRRWAESAGVELDARGYVRDHDANLRVPLSDATRAAFERGSELDAAAHADPRGSRRCIRPRRSSRTCSTIGPRATRRRSPRRSAARASPRRSRSRSRSRRASRATRRSWTSCCAARPGVASRSRASSASGSRAGRRTRRRSSRSTFPRAARLWLEHGLPRCQTLADELQSGAQRFKYLHAAQLLKHALGLARAAQPRSRAALSLLRLARAAERRSPRRDRAVRGARRVRDRLRRVDLSAALRGAAARARRRRGLPRYLRSRYFAARQLSRSTAC